MMLKRAAAVVLAAAMLAVCSSQGASAEGESGGPKKLDVAFIIPGHHLCSPGGSACGPDL